MRPSRMEEWKEAEDARICDVAETEQVVAVEENVDIVVPTKEMDGPACGGTEIVKPKVKRQRKKFDAYATKYNLRHAKISTLR